MVRGLYFLLIPAAASLPWYSHGTGYTSHSDKRVSLINLAFHSLQPRLSVYLPAVLKLHSDPSPLLSSLPASAGLPSTETPGLCHSVWSTLPSPSHSGLRALCVPWAFKLLDTLITNKIFVTSSHANDNLYDSRFCYPPLYPFLRA